MILCRLLCSKHPFRSDFHGSFGPHSFMDLLRLGLRVCESIHQPKLTEHEHDSGRHHDQASKVVEELLRYKVVEPGLDL